MKILLCSLLTLSTAIAYAGGPLTAYQRVHPTAHPSLAKWLREEFAYRDHDKDGSLDFGKRRLAASPGDPQYPALCQLRHAAPKP